MRRQRLIRLVAIVIIGAMVITTLFAGIGTLFY